jgi:hypothetical protein
VKPTAEKISDWARGNRLLIGVTQPRAGFSAQWRFDRADNGDILLEKDEQRAGQTTVGAVLLVGSGALAVRELRVERGHELDALNGPLLMLQLVLRLLERAVPSGPAGLTSDVQVELADKQDGIRVTGVGAEGEFFAPWRLKGVVGPGGNGQVKFELEFSSSSAAAGRAPYEVSIAGIWQHAKPSLFLAETYSLRGWRVYQLKPVLKPRGMINTLGLGTSPPLAFTNVGDLRRSVAQWGDEQARRARHQCN